MKCAVVIDNSYFKNMDKLIFIPILKIPFGMPLLLKKMYGFVFVQIIFHNQQT